VKRINPIPTTFGIIGFFLIGIAVWIGRWWGLAFFGVGSVFCYIGMEEMFKREGIEVDDAN
jgi:hypothetical protein